MLAYRKIPCRLLCDSSVNFRRQTVSGVVGSHVGASWEIIKAWDLCLYSGLIPFSPQIKTGVRNVTQESHFSQAHITLKDASLFIGRRHLQSPEDVGTRETKHGQLTSRPDWLNQRLATVKGSLSAWTLTRCNYENAMALPSSLPRLFSAEGFRAPSGLR